MNRDRLLTAAAAVFAEHGMEASVQQIARAAGVGMGTLYRRFPTKDDLIAELVTELLGAVSSAARTACAAPDGTGLEMFLIEAAQLQAAQRGCLSRLWNHSETPHAVADIRALMARLLGDAQRCGRARADLEPTDLSLLMWSVRGVIETAAEYCPPGPDVTGAVDKALSRYLQIAIAGLRPTGQPLLQAPALTDGELEQLRPTGRPRRHRTARDGRFSV